MALAPTLDKENHNGVTHACMHAIRFRSEGRMRSSKQSMLHKLQRQCE